MKKSIILICSFLLAGFIQVHASVTLEECQQLAQSNYPLLKKYGLVEKSTSYSMANIQKGYLPQIVFSAQGTYQSDVMAYPKEMTQLLSLSGLDIKGLQKDQYKVALDLNQIIWDGGAIQSQKQLAQKQGKVQQLQLDVELYGIRSRINDLYFGILLINTQLQQNADLQHLLDANCRKLESLQQNGVALQSDVDALRAEYLSAHQQQIQLESMQQSYRQMLSLFIGKTISSTEEFRCPASLQPIPEETSRPELALFDAQLALSDTQRMLSDAMLRPKLGLFAQGYYGYPGMNVFNDMIHSKWTLNGLVGIRFQWNIGNFYLRGNDLKKIDLSKKQIQTSRETFLFNNNLQTVQEQNTIQRYQKLLEEDAHIIDLRQSVRRAAESKLDNGVIDVNQLLQEIIRENSARQNRNLHQIELLKSMYELKTTLNN